VALADGAGRLQGRSGGWEIAALRGDIFAAGAALLGVLTQRLSEPCLKLPGSASVSATDLQQCSFEDIEIPSYTAGQLIDEAQAVSRAEAAYTEALATDSPDAHSTVGLSIGELWLSRAKRLKGEESFALLHRAGESFQKVATMKKSGADDETRASAWYNLACVASLLGKADHAAEALQRGLNHVPPAQRRAWAAEACKDQDLSVVRGHAQVQAVLSAYQVQSKGYSKGNQM